MTTINKNLGDLPCALIREFALPVTHPQWHYGAPSAHAISISEEYKNYHRFTENGKFAGNFNEFVFGLKEIYELGFDLETFFH
tara:strand:+ start:161 stop:409 length:249 start_codon:yes stop_codon:yes gene_type:complete